MQELVTRAPYHQWLGLKVIAVHDDGIELKATWREEWVVNLERRFTHGGILAALVDLGADWAMVRKPAAACRPSTCASTITPSRMPGDLTIKGKIVRMGGQFSTAEAHDLRRAGQAAGERPRHLFHRAAAAAEGVTLPMAAFQNLGDLIGRDRDLVQDRDHRSRRRGGAARVHLCRSSTP